MSQLLSKLILEADPTSAKSREAIDLLYTEVVDDAVDTIQRAREAEESTVYAALERKLADLRSDLRESVQAVTRKEMWDLILKLRGSQPITDEDLAMIRLWVVGDADAYVREENNYGDWVQELDRLSSEIRSLRFGPVDVERLEELRGLIMDAHGVTRSIAVLLTNRERVQNFDESTRSSLDPDARATLANILVRSYHSAKV